MKKIISLSLFLFVTVLVYSQENTTGSYMEMNTPSVEPEAAKDTTLRLNMPVTLNEKENVNFTYPNSYSIHDFWNKNPMGFYNEKIQVLNPYMFYSIVGSSEVWPGITTINNASYNINYARNGFLLTAGTDLWKYDNIGRSFVDATFHADASYQLLSWLTVGAYGQYSLLSVQNVQHGSALPSYMVPRTGFGGYARAMFTPMFGIEGSVGREFNPFNRKWEPTYGFGPVINLKKKKR